MSIHACCLLFCQSPAVCTTVQIFYKTDNTFDPYSALATADMELLSAGIPDSSLTSWPITNVADVTLCSSGPGQSFKFSGNGSCLSTHDVGCRLDAVSRRCCCCIDVLQAQSSTCLRGCVWMVPATRCWVARPSSSPPAPDQRARRGRWTPRQLPS